MMGDCLPHAQKNGEDPGCGGGDDEEEEEERIPRVYLHAQTVMWSENYATHIPAAGVEALWAVFQTLF